jgi:type I restriction enzyme S subunit
LDLAEVKAISATQAEIDRTRLATGDLLFVEGHANPREVGRVAFWDGSIPQCVHQNHLIRFRSDPSVLLPEYAVRWFNSSAGARHFQRSGKTTSGLNTISTNTVRSAPTLLPPLDEQRRIATTLDRADGLRAKRLCAMNLTQSLGLLIFEHMFGEIDKPRARHQTVRFGEIADLQGGRNLVAADPDARAPFQVLKISAVTSGTFKPGEAKPLPVDYTPPDEHLVRQGDLLISRANTAELVGAVAYVDSCPSNLALPDKIWRFVWKDPESVPLYYWALFRTPRIRRQISQLASGTGGSMKNISKAKLEQLELPYADPAQQGAFRKRLAAIPATSVAEFDELFASLQSRAFSGEL